MTTAQLAAIHIGLIGFVFVWPLTLLWYRRYLVSAAVVLYGCLASAVVFFPLPSAGTPRPVQTVQLVPFQWVFDVGTELGKHGWTIQDTLSTQTFQQVVMNVALFAPLGVFLWRRGLAAAAGTGFAASLLIEVTQLTANFGTAPFAYRIFDVDDLLTNTAGATLGCLLAQSAIRVISARTIRSRASAPTEPLVSAHSR